VRARKTVLVVSLGAVAATSVIQGASGGEAVAVPFTTLVPLVAAIAVVRTGKPLTGLIVAGWLALGPIFMPYAREHLSDPSNTGLFVGTIAQLAAIALAVLSGIGAQRAYGRTARVRG
jgi:hypothetical protein